ncbi:MAG: EthD domain-containing protein [Pseudomonadales bacterium]|nr:EthD domain-containing protein [Pseudomonadales bacterium]MBO7005840.1 EthD domain-containing protein [Pseudomonadales bacterium]
MIKLVMPMKRRPGMSVPEFREYYETTHKLLGEKYLDGYATRYIRRFTHPNRDRDGKIREPEYDVFLEIWYPNQESFEACGQALSDPAVAAEIRADEEKLFDLRYMRSYLVEECESDMNQGSMK